MQRQRHHAEASAEAGYHANSIMQRQRHHAEAAAGHHANSTCLSGTTVALWNVHHEPCTDRGCVPPHAPRTKPV